MASPLADRFAAEGMFTDAKWLQDGLIRANLWQNCLSNELTRKLKGTHNGEFLTAERLGNGIFGVDKNTRK